MIGSKGKETTSMEKIEKCQTSQNIESSSNESLNHVVDELVEAALASNQYSEESQVSSDSLDEALTQGRNMTVKDIYESAKVQDVPDEIYDEIHESEKQNQKLKAVALNLTSSNDNKTTFQRQTNGK